MTKIQELKTEINNLSINWSQAIDEVDGLLWRANEILNSLNSSDWNILNTELSEWNNDELRILAETIWTGNDGKDIVENNYTLGYIFTLTESSTASYLLMDYIGGFLIEMKVDSSELLDKMKIKLEKLKKERYLTETEYSDWITIFNKASR